MPKPNYDAVFHAIFGLTEASEAKARSAARSIFARFDAWEAEMREGREHGTPQSAGVPCGAAVDVEEWEQHNERQRWARKHFMEGAYYYDTSQPTEDGEAHRTWERRQQAEAARRYPLKKRVPRVVDDPRHPDVQWSVAEARDGLARHIVYRADPTRQWSAYPTTGVLLTLQRMEVLMHLFKSPWTYEDDSSAEEVER